MCVGAHLRFGFDVFSQEPLLVERVARLPRDGVGRALVDLLLDGTQQQEERLADRLLRGRETRMLTSVLLQSMK